MMKIKKLLCVIATIVISSAGFAHSAERIPDAQAVRNVVLVHGAFADGSGWRGVYDELTGRGYRVTIVQNPLTSLADDVAATKRILDRQDGPTLLVGHSYGGTVITEAGVDPKVAGLVYVSALAPDVGESTGSQFKDIPAPPEFIIETQEDGFGFIDLEQFRVGFAGDTSEADAAFLRDSQVPINMAIFDTPVTRAAWKSKPSWAVVATQDKAIDPALLRHTAKRIGAQVEEVDASHVPFLTQPKAVADAVDRAARGASR
ncbi:alpha/beta fold hydrolase [Stutzerimonas nosocomialis]|uniref:alpha/beta fold hydrolase n=1 Tax=Stutzerimonas nosocomialis TaxID=1056496 RepID=UPI0019D5F74C|nr:alpha/beta hydrolase [Stutzerimonas nosocomialis]